MESNSFTTPKSVLIIDDDDWFRVLVRGLLEGSGYKVFEAGSAAEGQRALHRERFDLLIADIMMPEIPGFQVIADARQEFPALKILAVSGVGRYLRTARLLGADGTAEKPFRPECFKESVRFLLS